MGREGTDRIRLGVIGYGYWGPNLARAFHDLPHSQLVAIADQKEEQLQRAVGRHPGVALVTDYRELFDMGLQAVVGVLIGWIMSRRGSPYLSLTLASLLIAAAGTCSTLILMPLWLA